MDLYMGLVTLILSSIMIVISQKIFLKKKIIDIINDRSSHASIAIRSGGIAIFSTLFLISTSNYLIGNTVFDYSVLLPVGLMVVVGLYDDIYNVDFKLKFIFQIIAAKMIIDNGLIIDNLHGFFGVFEVNRILAQIITIFIIVAIINAVNFIDGIDGLAISIVSMFLILFEFIALDQTPFNNLTIILLISFVPLFYFNYRNKNKVFLGDSGSLLLGSLVSIYVLYALSNEYIIKPRFDINKIIFVFSILSYPIIDFTRIFFKRIIDGGSPFLADKNHIHHKLLNYYNSHIVVVTIIISSSIIIFVLSQGFNFLN
jgi:UDP-N-acetylmuramyl pentapeptide phosphotransferase/UDP-N-acetylglucosamine-1-phosphate transferase